MGGCQNYGPFLGTLNTRCRITIGIQKGTINLTTTHMGMSLNKGPLKCLIGTGTRVHAGVRLQDFEWDVS